MKQGLVRLLYNLGKVHGVDITHDNVCSSMLSSFYSHLLSTGRPISSFHMFYKTTTYMDNIAKMIYHTGTLSLIQNIFHTIRHYDIQIKTSFFNSNIK